MKQILLAMSSDEKKKHLAKTAKMINDYVENVEQWTAITNVVKPIHNATQQVIGTEIIFKHSTLKHGYIFVGAFLEKGRRQERSVPVAAAANKGKQELALAPLRFIRPILLAFDKNGVIQHFDTREIVQAFKDVSETAFTPFEANTTEMELIGACYDQIAPFMLMQHIEQSKPIVAQNDKLIKNWSDNRRWQYKSASDKLREQIAELKAQKNTSKLFQEKMDLQKKIDKLEKQLNRWDEKFHISMIDIERQAEKDRAEFNAQFAFDPIALINLVVTF